MGSELSASCFEQLSSLEGRAGFCGSGLQRWEKCSSSRSGPFSSPDSRLRKHADYQRVYQQSHKHFSPSMAYFFAERPSLQGPRVGLTARRVLGKAVERNRIKRRMREIVRHNLALLTR